jgi:hypothetical protein
MRRTTFVAVQVSGEVLQLGEKDSSPLTAAHTVPVSFGRVTNKINAREYITLHKIPAVPNCRSLGFRVMGAGLHGTVS